MKRNGVALCIATLAAAVLPAAARAQAFGLNEIGSCAVARGFAVTGAPCNDGSAIYWNPGATTAQADRLTLLVGAAAIGVSGEFRADHSGRVDEGDVPTELPPHFFANWKATPRLAAGIGVYVPYGLTSQWKDDFPGRFSAKRASLASIYVQPNVAFEVVPGRLSVGAGPVIGHSDVTLRQSIDLSQQRTSASGPAFAALGIPPGTEFAQAKLHGNAMAYGFNAGVSARVLPTLQIGARYLSRLTFDYDDADATFYQAPTGLVLAGAVPNPAGGAPLLPAGTLVDTLVAPQFRSGGALTRQKVATSIAHPAQFQVGVGYSGFPGTTLSLDAVWVGWSAFKSLPVNFANPATPDRDLIEDYKDVWGIRAGAEHRFGIGVVGRAGFAFAPSPAPDASVTPLLPDMDRYNYSLGLGLPLGGRFAVDASYLTVQTQGRRGRIEERTSRSQTAAQLNSGFYTLNANIFSLSLKATY
jgi:long-chain fatty acid transport protein